MLGETCCTCASIISSKPPTYYSQNQSPPTKNAQTEKSDALDALEPPVKNDSPEPYRRLPCCNRNICASCLKSNPRFENYCPFCQISTAPTSLPQGLRDPPAYTSRPPSPKHDHPAEQQHTTSSPEDPPSYSSLNQDAASASTTSPESQQDLTHYLRSDDTIASLSLAYNIAPAVLRSHNSIYADHLLSARRTVSIPRAYYSGPSLSPDPVESEEETERKSGIRRFMVATKCHEYDVAELYLSQTKGDVGVAVEKWKDDDRWEKENPLDRSKLTKNKGKRGIGGGLTGQLR